MKTIILVFSAPAIGTVGQLLLKHVMKSVGPVGTAHLASAKQIVFRLLGNPLFIAAVGLYFVGFLVWLVVLSKLELSYAYPILALSYCLVPLLSHIVFGEQVSLMRWVGIGIICCGVGIVGISR